VSCDTAPGRPDVLDFGDSPAEKFDGVLHKWVSRSVTVLDCSSNVFRRQPRI
jgi:hypothetical protein